MGANVLVVLASLSQALLFLPMQGWHTLQSASRASQALSATSQAPLTASCAPETPILRRVLKNA